MNKVLAWFKQRVLRLLIYGLLAAAISWLGNVFFLAYLNEGFGGRPANGITLTSSTFKEGAVFWAAACFVCFALIGYWRRVGSWRFWRSVIAFPHWLGQQFHTNQRRETSFYFMGLALGLMVTAYLNIYLSLILAIALFAIAPSWIAGMAASLISKMWDSGKRLIGRSSDRPLVWRSSVAVTLVGLATACLIVFLIEMRFPRLGFALILALIAVRFARKRSDSAATMMMLLGSSVLMVFGIADSFEAFADDGGWKENGGNLRDWLNGDGSDRVMEESIPAAPIGGGAGVLGGAAGEAVGEDKPIMTLDEIAGPGTSDTPVVEDIADTGPPGFRDMALGEGDATESGEEGPEDDEAEDDNETGDSTPRTS